MRSERTELTKSWLLAVLFLPFLVACGGRELVSTPGPAEATTAPVKARPEWEEKWEKIVQGARKEGKVMVYAGFGVDARTAVQKAFGEKYGIDVEFVAGRGPELMPRIVSERRAGLYLADIFVDGPAGMIDWIRTHDIVAPLGEALVLPEVLAPSSWLNNQLPSLDKERKLFPFIGTNLRFLAVNTELVREGEIKSARDVLAPKWKGKISLNDPTLPGAGASWLAHLALRVWSVEEGKDFARGLINQEVVLTRNTRQAAEWLAQKKHAINIGADSEDTATFIAAGAPVATAKIAEGTLVSNTGGGVLALLRDAPHPNGALLFINWLLSREGQTVFVQAFKQPSLRLDAPTAGINKLFFVEPDEKGYIRTEDDYVSGNQFMGTIKEIFSEARR